MSHIPFISDPAEITPAWLTQALGENGHLTDGRVTDVSFDERMKADRQINRVFVTYSDEARGTRPASIVFKQSSNGSRNVSDVSTCAAVRETMFYEQFIAKTPNLRIARCYATGVDETGQSYLSLEDLSESHELLPDSGTRSPFGGWKCFDNVDPRVFEALILSVAELHVGWWGQPGILEGVFAWSSGDLPSVVDTATESYTARVEHELGEKEMADEDRDLCLRAVRAWPAVYDAWKSSGGVETLIHNDFHLRNVVVPVEQGHPVIFDWENVCRGVGAYDIADLFTCSMLSRANREACERATLPAYAQALRDRGVDYGMDACERDYRIGVIGVLVNLYGPSSARNSILDAFRAWDCEAVLSEVEN